MLRTLAWADYLTLFLFLSAMPAAGIVIALRKRSAETYFLAGRSLRWWAVAGSIFGTNINSSHLIGMLGIGYSVGFAQSHYEVLAVPAILLLAYVFLPAYRQQRVFTLSQFLEYRYNASARLVYTILMLGLIGVQLVGGLYIGSRTLVLLFQGTNFELAYWQGVTLIALITCSYTIWGGLESVVVTDNIQSAMMLAAGILVAVLTFAQPEIGGFTGLLDLERGVPEAARKMQLYLPTNHPNLPWSGAFTGLVIMHLFYWTTNQYLVQRTLAAESDRQAKLGVVASGFLKLTVPFFSVATGVAAAYLFKARFGEASALPDDAFLKLVETVVPTGYGFTGFILAGLTAATFSSVDSMMNSATTLLTLDVYKKYVNPAASDRQMLRFGRLAIVAMISLAAYAALQTYDPRSADNFFLKVSAQGSYLTPGVVAAFFVGLFWRRAHPVSAVVTMLSAPAFAIAAERIYAATAPAGLVVVFGPELNFMHRVLLTLTFCIGLHLLLSRLLSRRYTHETLNVDWTAGELLRAVGGFLALQIPVIVAFRADWLSPALAAGLGAVLAFVPFGYRLGQTKAGTWLADDRFWAGILSGCTVAILYFFA